MAVIKIIKFDLPIDGVKVKDLDELREHFTVEILELYNNGMLLKWLRSRKMLEEAEQLEQQSLTGLSPTLLLKALSEVFKVDADDMVIAAALGMSPEKMEKNFPEIKAQYRAIAYEEVKVEERMPTVSGKYLIYKNGTVTDTKTKLMWKQDCAGEYTWYDAIAKFGKNVSFAGYDDWRMPTKEELETLVDKNHSPTIDPIAFPNTPFTVFWASSMMVSGMSLASSIYGNGACVAFGYGDCNNWSLKNAMFQVRLVRGGQ